MAAVPSTLTLNGPNGNNGPILVYGNGILSIPTITDGGVPGPLGTLSSDPANLTLGFGHNDFDRGTLRLSGTAANYSTDRGITVAGLYAATFTGGFTSRSGGAIDSVSEGSK